MLCAEWSLVKHDGATSAVIPLRCKCWTCDECAPWRKNLLVYEAKSGNPNLFITLTSKRRLDWSPEYAAQRLVKAWRQVRLEFMRLHNLDSFPFLAVFEKTKKGWPHLHIVARCEWLSQKWLSERMKEIHGSPIVDVRRVHGKSKVAAYVSKYISKDPTRFPGTKRYWRSMDYLSKALKQHPAWQKWEAPWEIYKEDWRSVAEGWEKWGHQVTYLRHEAYIGERGPP